MSQFHVTYYYLATGMEGRPDERDYGYIEAANELDAKQRIAARECKDARDIDWMVGCLSAKRT